MSLKPDKRTTHEKTAIFFVEKCGTSESFTNFLKFRKLTSAESALIKREVLQHSERESHIYAAAFRTKGLGAEQVRPGNRAISRVVDAISLFEDVRLNRAIPHANLVIIDDGGKADGWSYVLDTGVRKSGLGEPPRQELNFDCYSHEIAACLNIEISDKTKQIHKALGLALHFFRRGMEAEQNILKFIFLVCAVDNIGGDGKGKTTTDEIVTRLKGLYPKEHQDAMGVKIRKAFSKRGKVFHANRILDDVTLDNEKFMYYSELSLLRRLFLDAFHGLLPFTKTENTLRQAWNKLSATSPNYDHSTNDAVMTSMSKMQRIGGDYSADTQAVLKQIAASALNPITRPSRVESP
jgi:hypothetical protein